jgi:hypothetical protein
MSDIKSVMISGEAAKSMGGATRRRASRKKTQGGGEVEGIESSLAARSAPVSPVVASSTTQGGAPVTVTRVQAPPQQAPPQQATPPQATLQQGGDKKIRVELKKKPLTKKVQLHPKKADAPKAVKKQQTKKNRKVLLGMSSLHKRVTRAKKVHTKMKDMPLEKLKALLISKKLIKPASKAPESVLRQIAADAHIVEKNAL